MAVKSIALNVDGILVVGAKNSSNSNLLVEVARGLGAKACLVEKAAEIPIDWVNGQKQVGVTAVASTPEVVVQRVVDRLNSLGLTRVEEYEWITEDVRFGVPPEVKDAAHQAGLRN